MKKWEKAYCAMFSLCAVMLALCVVCVTMTGCGNGKDGESDETISDHPLNENDSKNTELVNEDAMNAIYDELDVWSDGFVLELKRKEKSGEKLKYDSLEVYFYTEDKVRCDWNYMDENDTKYAIQFWQNGSARVIAGNYLSNANQDHNEFVCAVNEDLYAMDELKRLRDVIMDYDTVTYIGDYKKDSVNCWEYSITGKNGSSINVIIDMDNSGSVRYCAIEYDGEWARFARLTKEWAKPDGSALEYSKTEFENELDTVFTDDALNWLLYWMNKEVE